MATRNKKQPPAASVVGFAYARYSSHNQREESIEQQIMEIRKFAKDNNIEIIETFSDAAMTGRNDRRPQFQRMMREAKKHRPNVIIAYKSNRIARNMLNALATESELEKIGVRVLYVKETFGDNAAGRFALRTMMNVNQFYSENMAEDIIRGLMDNAENCMVNNGSLPLGYKKGEDGRYAIDEAGAAIVREIYQKVAADVPLAEIAEDLNARGIRTSRGGPWNKNSFHNMLQNETYIGVYKYAGVRTEGGVPPIITGEEWIAVQEHEKRKKAAGGSHRARGEYLLTGKLFCGKCGAPMVGISGTSKTAAKYYYYICRNKREEKSCTKETVGRDWLERLVVEETVRRVLQDDVIAAIADAVIKYQTELKEDNSVLFALQDELGVVTRSIKNIVSAIEAGVFTPSTRVRLEELEDQKSALEAGISREAIKLPDVTKEQIIFWFEKLRDGDVDDHEYQRTIINTFINAIYLYDGEIRICYNYSGAQNTVTLSIASLAGSGGGLSGSSTSASLSPPIKRLNHMI